MIELRPSSAGVGYLRGLSIAALVVGGIQSAITGKGLWVTVLTIAIAAVVCLGGIELWRRGSRIRRDARGPVRWWRLGIPQRPRDAQAGVYLPEVVNGFGVIVPRLALFDRDSRPVLRVGGELWEPAQIDALARSFAPALVIVDGPIPAKAAIQGNPEAFAFRERRPFVFATLIVLGFVGFCGIIVVIAVSAG